MLNIHSDQIDVFKETALKQFEDEMVEHVQDFFPNHFALMGEEGIRTLTRYGYVRAKPYGLISKRNVCLYINSMLLLGSHFDKDPQYPWASEILNNESGINPNDRMDAVSEKMLDFMEAISGPRHLNIYRAALNMKNNHQKIYQTLVLGDIADTSKDLFRLFPKKHEAVGEEHIEALVKKGVTDARRYGIKDESLARVYILFMFSMGAGFASDPQFPWTSQILNDDTIPDERAKVELLFQTAITTLEDFLLKYKNH